MDSIKKIFFKPRDRIGITEVTDTGSDNFYLVCSTYFYYFSNKVVWVNAFVYL